ncbi:MAG: hypothetical protein WC637_21620, partial [Victivallales bacterium]
IVMSPCFFSMIVMIAPFIDLCAPIVFSDMEFYFCMHQIRLILMRKLREIKKKEGKYNGKFNASVFFRRELFLAG